MPDKKNTSLRIDPITHKRLRLLGVEHGLPLGEVIAALVEHVAATPGNPRALSDAMEAASKARQ